MWQAKVNPNTRIKKYGVLEPDGVKSFICYLRAVDGKRICKEVISSSVNVVNSIIDYLVSELPVYEQNITHCGIITVPELGIKITGELKQADGISYICSLEYTGRQSCTEVIPSTIEHL